MIIDSKRSGRIYPRAKEGAEANTFLARVSELLYQSVYRKNQHQVKAQNEKWEMGNGKFILR